jgi:hypothetical protein
VKAEEAMNKRRAHVTLRQAGLRPVTIWVPDTRRSDFAEECRRQSQLLQGDAHEQESAGWLESVADHKGWRS